MQAEATCCKRFLEKGNKPVPKNYEEHEVIVMPKAFDPAVQGVHELVVDKEENEQRETITQIDSAQQ